MANKRIYYAIQQVTIGNPGVAVHGLQSVGISTNFSLEQVFELGQLEIYQNIEEVPEVEVTLQKVLDGYPLIYCLATEGGSQIPGTQIATGASLSGRQNARCDVRLGIYDDTIGAAQTGTTAQNTVLCKGMYVSSVSYSFPVDGNFTEDVTLVGNDKSWAATQSGAFDENNPDSPASVSVMRRQFIDILGSSFPVDVTGGGMVDGGSGEGWSTHFQNITVSCDLGRESLQELGRFAPYHRYATFPVEVTSEFEVLSTTGDNITATEEGYLTESSGGCTRNYNLRDNTIIIKTCEGTTVDLGDKNKLTSVNYSGGDTGGGNVTVSYSFVTYNSFKVTHPTSVVT